MNEGVTEGTLEWPDKREKNGGKTKRRGKNGNISEATVSTSTEKVRVVVPLIVNE